MAWRDEDIVVLDLEVLVFVTPAGGGRRPRCARREVVDVRRLRVHKGRAQVVGRRDRRRDRRHTRRRVIVRLVAAVVRIIVISSIIFSGLSFFLVFFSAIKI